LNRADLLKRHTVLNEQLAELRVKIAKVSGQILTSPVDDMSKLVSERMHLEQEDTALVKLIFEIRSVLHNQEKQERKKTEADEKEDST